MNRPVAVALVLLVVLLAWALMYLGWRRRTGRQADVAAPPAAPDALRAKAETDGVEGVYVSTTAAGDWLQRLTVHGLGVRSQARLLVDPSGVLIVRTGAPEVFIPATTLADVRRETMRAGKAVPGGGLVVLEWALGDTLAATAFRPRRVADRDPLLAAVRALTTSREGS